MEVSGQLRDSFAFPREVSPFLIEWLKTVLESGRKDELFVPSGSRIPVIYPVTTQLDCVLMHLLMSLTNSLVLYHPLWLMTRHEVLVACIVLCRRVLN